MFHQCVVCYSGCRLLLFQQVLSGSALLKKVKWFLDNCCEINSVFNTDIMVFQEFIVKSVLCPMIKVHPNIFCRQRML